MALIAAHRKEIEDTMEIVRDVSDFQNPITLLHAACNALPILHVDWSYWGIRKLTSPILHI